MSSKSGLPFDVPEPPKTPPPFDTRKVTSELGKLLGDALMEVSQGATTDLIHIADQVAPLLVTAVATGDTALQEELEEQIGMIAEINHIRADTKAREVLMASSRIAFGALSVGLGSLLTPGGDA